VDAMPRLQIVRDERLRKTVEEAIRQGKLIIIAQRDTTRIVKPEKPEKVVFIAREDVG